MGPPIPSTKNVAPIRSGATSWTLRAKKRCVNRRPCNDFSVTQHMLRLRHMFTTFVIQAFTAPFLPQDSMISIHECSHGYIPMPMDTHLGPVQVHGRQDQPQEQAAQSACDRGSGARAAPVLLLCHGADRRADSSAFRW